MGYVCNEEPISSHWSVDFSYVIVGCIQMTCISKLVAIHKMSAALQKPDFPLFYKKCNFDVHSYISL